MTNIYYKKARQVKIYDGKVEIGILHLFSCGLFEIAKCIDVIVILCKQN